MVVPGIRSQGQEKGEYPPQQGMLALPEAEGAAFPGVSCGGFTQQPWGRPWKGRRQHTVCKHSSRE